MKTKAFLTLLLSMAFALSFTACKGDEDISSTPESNSIESTVSSSSDSSEELSESDSEEYVEILPDGSLENPFWIIEDTTQLHIEAGKTLYFASRSSSTLNFEIANANLSVLLNDVTYTAEDGVVSFQLVPQIGAITIFSITNTAEVAIDTTLQAVYPLGSMQNPFVLTESNGEVIAEVPQGTPLYYKWVATAEGTFTVISDNPKNYIFLQNGYVQSNATWGEDSTSINCKVGDTVIITVGTLDNEAAVIDFEYSI